jgi:conjugative relaxase-like TrwC/TraI family protein
VLGIHRLTSQGAHYYLSDLAQELPLPQRWEPGPATWVGRAAQGLGLEGDIEPAQLQAVLLGLHPTGDHRLRSDRATVLGFDLTFSAPKSVSVVGALGGEDTARQVVAAHRAGVRGAVSYVEAHALAATRGSGERRQLVPTTGLVGASFTHGVSRNLDPHLHTHVVLANLVHGFDGRWSACDHRGLWAHGRAAAAVYDAHLRAELTTRLGVRWAERPGRRTEIEGVSPLVMGEFSSRGADIRRHMAEWGSHSSRGARVAWAATRPEKPIGLSFRELSSEWERRAHAVGGSRAQVAALLGQREAATSRTWLDEHRFRAVLSLAPDGAARRRDLVAAFSTAAVAGVDAPGVERLTELWAPANADRPEVGVAEETRTLRSVVPGAHLFDALGPRPVDPAAHEVWREAARAIDGYRSRWGAADEVAVPGGAGSRAGATSLDTDRLIQHLRTSQQVEVARQRLGWRPPRPLELDRGR